MANPHLTISVQYADLTIADLRRELILRNVADNATEDDRNKRRVMDTVWRMINGVVGGARRAKVRVVLSGVAATQTVDVAVASAVNDTDTITIAGRALSLKTSPANENEFGPKPATDALYVAQVVAAINANSTLQKVVFAKAVDSNTFSVTSLFPGPIGNLILLAEAGNGFTLGGSALATGASDALHSYNFNYVP